MNPTPPSESPQFLLLLKAAIDEHAIVAVTDAAGRITYVNDLFCAISGYARDELIGQTHRLISSGVHPPGFFADLWTTITAGRVWRGEICNRAKAGHLYWIRTTILPVVEEGGMPTQYLALRTDVTELKRAQLEVEQLAGSLERQVQARTAELESALRELAQMSSTIAHDLRGPLTGIDGFSKMLEKRLSGRLDEREAHYFNRIGVGVKRMAEIIDAMLEMGRVSRGELDLQPLDLAELAREALAGCQRSTPERQVQVKLQQPLPALADRRLLNMAINHLVGNAWKFTSGRDDAVIEIGVEAGVNGEPVWFVRDNGVGLDMAFADKLFSMFQKLQNPAEFPGMGVGLAVVRRVVERHHGRVWAEGSPGAGATFRFSLGPQAGGLPAAGPDRS